jgi:hypothetical protein
MAFTQTLKFSELTKLLEELANDKNQKKRDKYMSDYMEKLLKFQSDYKSKNENSVSKNNLLYLDCHLTGSLYFNKGLISSPSYPPHPCSGRKRKSLWPSRENTSSALRESFEIA